jgi:hypothetical protein
MSLQGLGDTRTELSARRDVHPTLSTRCLDEGPLADLRASHVLETRLSVLEAWRSILYHLSRPRPRETCHITPANLT